jgi:hypothetical protein
MKEETKNRENGGATFQSTAIEAAISGLFAGGTQITLQETIKWTKQAGFPDQSLDNAVLAGSLIEQGLYLTLVRWHPGYMSAPHTYATDRLCVVVSGTWWVNCGPEFDPIHCVPVPAGSFVRRVARTPHYDGVVSDGQEPAIVAICGLAPVDVKLVDPTNPAWRNL